MTPPINDKNQNKKVNNFQNMELQNIQKEEHAQLNECTMVNKLLKNQGGLKLGQ